MRTILDEIVATKRAEVAAAKASRPIEVVRDDARRARPPRDFMTAVFGGDALAVIAEIKKASPSAGLIVRDFDPSAIARVYARHAAAAISVLTDRTYFQGDPAYIGAVKGAVDLPVLRKDFIVEAYQVHESRAMGADAVLLIAEVLGGAGVAELLPIARGLDMAVLVEVHEPQQLDAVLDAVGEPEAGGYLLGFNNRDLRAQQTDLETTSRLAKRLFARAGRPVPFVAESGIHTPDDVRRVRSAGAGAILVGESILKSPDIGAKLDELRSSGG